jgi:hypothetical protein
MTANSVLSAYRKKWKEFHALKKKEIDLSEVQAFAAKLKIIR